jgi:L-2-hydroxyglutarate oxidase LhgO
MSYLDGVVYPAPSEKFPALAVVFKADGGILVAHPAASVKEAESFLKEILEEVESRRPDEIATDWRVKGNIDSVV